ncbi:MAG TPA: phosphoadenylyl-sulfate reductase [Myxococcales bacterium]
MKTTGDAATRELAAEAEEVAARGSVEELLAWAERRIGPDGVIATTFSIQDVILVHLASLHAPGLKVVTLDTGRLPPETFEAMEEVRQRYGIEIETWFPDRAAVERLEREKGFFSFRQSVKDRIECCAIRKDEPLGRALSGRKAWFTGSRRADSAVRVEVVELDEEHGGIVKINPLARWTDEDVWGFARSHAIPIHTLHVRGYPSIDCAPCIRPVAPGEDPRMGRFWWEAPAPKDRTPSAGRRR